MRDNKALWQQILSEGFSSVEKLLEFLQLPKDLGSNQAHLLFKTRVPRRFANLMEKGNPCDPLLLQVLPVFEEMLTRKGYYNDPLQENNANPVKGLLHKYHGRVLMTFGACAINCRYCFRRHFEYEQNSPLANFEEVIQYIRKDTTIKEVILSGGDPLLGKNNILFKIVTKLNEISHLDTLRIHSRVPVVLPERIDDEFLDILTSSRLKKILVLHCNHPNEIDDAVIGVCEKLLSLNVLILNQSVLLKGVNDNSDVLVRLMRTLFGFGVIPYYLHMLDKVSGVGHFDVSKKQAKKIYSKLQAQLPGYMVPKIVIEQPGKANKTLMRLN